MLNSMPSKSVTKSIVRTMEMNGTLETRPARLKSKEVKKMSEEEIQEEEEDEDEEDEEEEDEEEEEEEEVIRDVKKGDKVIKTTSENNARRKHSVNVILFVGVLFQIRNQQHHSLRRKVQPGDTKCRCQTVKWPTGSPI